MYIPYIVLVVISFAGIIFILVSKISEIKTGNTRILNRLSITTEPRLRRFVEKTRAILREFNKVNAKRIFTAFAHGVFHLFGTAGLFVSKHHKRLTSKVNGKRNIKGGGVVSFFLKRVAEAEKKEEK